MHRRERHPVPALTTVPGFPGPDLVAADPAAGVLPGLRYVGGSLDAATLLGAVGHGCFPLPTQSGALGWYAPDPRGVLVHDSLRRERETVRVARRWQFSCDRAFDDVVRGCADRDEVWIDDDYRAVYRQLHRAGSAHSVEVWDGDDLIGGLFGLAIGRFWSGESMFQRRRNASKAAVYTLVDLLVDQGCTWHDVQYLSTHTRALGATELPQQEFLEWHATAIEGPTMVFAGAAGPSGAERQ